MNHVRIHGDPFGDTPAASALRSFLRYAAGQGMQACLSLSAVPAREPRPGERPIPLTDGVRNWNIQMEPILRYGEPGWRYEAWGCEDARVTYLPGEQLWYIMYTAYSSTGPAVALARSKDLVTAERIGLGGKSRALVTEWFAAFPPFSGFADGHLVGLFAFSFFDAAAAAPAVPGLTKGHAALRQPCVAFSGQHCHAHLRHFHHCCCCCCCC